MEKEIIQRKFDWVATLNQFKKGEIHTFNINVKEVFNIRQVACRMKKKDSKVFKTSTLENGIIVKRVS